MSESRKFPKIPQSVPKLEAELIRDAYETARRDVVSPGLGEGSSRTGATDDLSEAERHDFYRRILDAGVSQETLVELGFSTDE